MDGNPEPSTSTGRPVRKKRPNCRNSDYVSVPLVDHRRPKNSVKKSNENKESSVPQSTEVSDNENLIPKPPQLNPVPKVINQPSHVRLGPIRPPWEFYTAFRLVEWKHWPFGDSNIDNGKALVDAGHVQMVKEVDKPGTCYYWNMYPSN